METRANTLSAEAQTPDAALGALTADSPDQVAAEARNVERFFNGDNSSMMGGWT